MALKERKIDWDLYEIAPEDEELKINEIAEGKDGKKYYIRTISADAELYDCEIVYSEVNGQGKPKAKKFVSSSTNFGADILRQIIKAYKKKYTFDLW